MEWNSINKQKMLKNYNLIKWCYKVKEIDFFYNNMINLFYNEYKKHSVSVN